MRVHGKVIIISREVAKLVIADYDSEKGVQIEGSFKETGGADGVGKETASLSEGGLPHSLSA